MDIRQSEFFRLFPSIINDNFLLCKYSPDVLFDVEKKKTSSKKGKSWHNKCFVFLNDNDDDYNVNEDGSHKKWSPV